MGTKDVGVLLALISSVASIQLGCGSGAVERGDDRDSTSRTSKLGQLAADLGRGETVPHGSLPPEADGGRRFEQLGGGVGFVFKFDSTKAAESSLPNLLRQSVSGGPPRPQFGGVTGCGSFAWFTQGATSPTAELWKADVHRLLKKIDRPCAEGRTFSIIT